MGIKKLTVENAQIKTASVEVKTLTISGKQVTLAVFRQLPEIDLIDRGTLELKGAPWGHVNYHPDKCSDNPEHLHVVWQQDQTLARMAFYRTPDHTMATERLMTAQALLYAKSDLASWASQQSPSLLPNWRFAAELARTTIEGYGSDRIWFSVQCGGKRIRCDYRFSPNRSGLECLLEAWEAVGSPPPEQYVMAVEQAVTRHDQYLAKYSDLWLSMNSLDQLFIAV